MRIVPLAVFASVLVLAAPARADVGPAPVCPPGTHGEYLQGRRCVANGSHLELDRDGGLVTTVVDKPSAVAPSSSTPSAAPSASAAPSKGGCSVTTIGARDGAFAWLALASLIAARRRGRPSAR